MFWTRGSGKALRGDAAAQVVALYLMTSPATSMVGIFHLALPTLCHETGLSLLGARKGLRRCSEEGIAHYDEAEELVFVPALAKHQVGDTINPNDRNKIKGILNALLPYKGHKFHDLFVMRYAQDYCIPNDGSEGASEGLAGPLEGAPSCLVLSCLEGEALAGAGAGAAPAPPKPKRAPSKTPIPADFALTEKHLEHAKAKGYPEWWARNRFEAFAEAAGAKGFMNANWDLALYGSWRREMHEWGNTPHKLAHLAPKGALLTGATPEDAAARAARAKRAAEVEARARGARAANGGTP